jgi:hypothetical protein
MSIIHAHGGSVCGIRKQEYVILVDESARKDVYIYILGARLYLSSVNPRYSPSLSKKFFRREGVCAASACPKPK